MTTFVKSFLAGMLISLGGIVYLMCSSTNKIMGSFLFAFGLFTIVNLKLNLYTGKIGYLVEKFNLDYIKELIITLIGNFIGTLFMALLLRFTRLANNTLLYGGESSIVGMLVNSKINDNLLSILILSIFCGMLMFLGVDSFRRIEDYLGKTLAIIFAVMLFILSGFEHCIANMFYFNFAGKLDVVVLLIMILGNSLGAMFICFLYRCAKLNDN